MKTAASVPFRHVHLFAVLLAFVATPAIAQTTIYADNFDRGSVGTPQNLDGTTPTTTTGGATWTASSALGGTPWTTNGTVLSVVHSGTSARLPVTLVAGTTYRISADVSVRGDGADYFVGLGFGNSATSPLYNSGAPWIAFTGISTVQAWGGTGKANNVYDADPSWVTNTANLRIDYTYNAGSGTTNASYYVDDTQIGSTYVYTSNPTIDSVFLTSIIWGNGGTFDNFSLVTVVPEPASTATIASVAALALLLAGRRVHIRRPRA